MSHADVLKAAGLSTGDISGGSLAVRSPIDGDGLHKGPGTCA